MAHYHNNRGGIICVGNEVELLFNTTLDYRVNKSSLLPTA